MNLRETVVGMLSNNYKERFISEYQQVFIRYTGLLKMVEKWDKGTLEFNPTCPRSVYDNQLSAMKDYIEVLKQRADIEGINLS